MTDGSIGVIALVFHASISSAVSKEILSAVNTFSIGINIESPLKIPACNNPNRLYSNI